MTDFWSREEIETAIELYNQEASLSKIAAKVGRSRSAVNGKIRRLSEAGDPRLARNGTDLRSVKVNGYSDYELLEICDLFEGEGAAQKINSLWRTDRATAAAYTSVYGNIMSELEASEL